MMGKKAIQNVKQSVRRDNDYGYQNKSGFQEDVEAVVCT